MKAVIIAVGDEVLEGDVINSNAAFLSQQLIEMGFEILYHKTVGDYALPLEESFNEAYEKAGLIIMTGGLGPTKDDMTKKTISDAMGLELVFDEEQRKVISEYFSSSGRVMSDNNLSQCFIPKGGRALPNAFGTAPGVYIESSDRTVIMLPGPPRELNPMFLSYARPALAEKTKKTFSEKYYMAAGIGEAPLESLIRASVPESSDYMINTYITQSGVMVKATGRGSSEEEAEAVIGRNDDALKKVLDGYLYAEEKKELWETVCGILMQRNLSISSAESFTGGLFSETLSRISGISSVFRGAVASYSTQSKINILGVSSQTIEQYGAVSEQTAKEMAECASKLFGSDIALSFTGAAGPEGADGKPAGTVYIGIYFKGRTLTDTNLIISDRETVKSRSVNRAFYMLYQLLCGQEQQIR